MEEIVRRLIENHRIDEMAYKRADAMDLCLSLGKLFVEHFHKVYLEGVSSEDFEHHCQELQSWYDKVRNIKFKRTNNLISNINLIDWFFTVGAGVEDHFTDEKEADIYNEFIVNLLASRRTNRVVDVVKDLLSQEISESSLLKESRVGAFYFIGDKIISNDIDVRDADKYGDFVNYSSHWDLWSAFVKQYPDYKYLDYDYFPRGRVIYDASKHKYILYFDDKLNHDKYLSKIKSRYRLHPGGYEIGKDEHYESQQPLDDFDDDELEKDVIFGESLDYYVKRETY